jgi:hypothetical protein
VSDPEPEFDILGKLKHRDKISAKYNYPCRGHSFDAKTLIVLGTPYKDQATIWELALALWGFKELPRSKYTRRKKENGYFLSWQMSYLEPHLRPIEEFLVTSDLVQAVGRIRPLQSDGLVFVISNGLITDWEVEQFMAAELLEIKIPMRKDASEAFDRYSAAAEQLLSSGNWIKNSSVCVVVGMPIRTGSKYWNRLKDEKKDVLEVEGPRVRLSPPDVDP